MKIDRILKDFILVKVAPLLISNRDLPLSPEIYKGPFRKISYCVSCMGRSFHLKRTLLKNIEDNKNYPHVEFVIVNYNSADDLHEWALNTLRPHFESGMVSYFHTKDPQTFHMSKAKNLSHRLASGDLLVNLDADNYSGKDGAFFLNHAAKESENAFFRLRGKGFRYHDTSGRIAVFRQHFFELGGYDESMMPFRYQDTDFVKRLEASGHRLIILDKVNFIRTIKHGNVLRGNLLGAVDFDELYATNRKISEINIARGALKANPNGFERFRVFKNLSDVFFEV